MRHRQGELSRLVGNKLMRTILCHFYNEEYLLPFWLKHHRKFFDHGIMIDYDSTDGSVELIKELCPTWTVVKSRNRNFDAAAVDEEVMDIEAQITGTRICLNVTEFIIGDFSKSAEKVRGNALEISAVVMVDKVGEQDGEITDLITDRTNGVILQKSGDRMCRCMHEGEIKYSPGRHFIHGNTDDFLILWYGFSPWNEKAIKRKLQIQQRMTEHDIRLGRGLQHLTTGDKLQSLFLQYQQKSEDLSPIIRNANIPGSGFAAQAVLGVQTK